MTHRWISGLALAALICALPACKKKGAGAAPGGSASARPGGSAASPGGSADPAVARAAAMRAAVAKVVNPRGEEPYAGPTGTLKGKVRIVGDEPPDSGFTIPSKCTEAIGTHGKLFRVGQDNTVGDVLVAVTNYEGYVPAKNPMVKVTIQGCALSRRTIAMTFGQRLEVSNKDSVDSYTPYLDGAPTKATMVAVPGGDPVKLYVPEPGHYLLRDQLPNPHLVADVFVLAYATHDTTGLDGRYEIKGIPVGKVKVNAFLPAINKTVEQVVTIMEGTNTNDLSITFSAKTDLAPPAASSASAGASAAPSAGPPK